MSFDHLCSGQSPPLNGHLTLGLVTLRWRSGRGVTPGAVAERSELRRAEPLPPRAEPLENSPGGAPALALPSVAHHLNLASSSLRLNDLRIKNPFQRCYLTTEGFNSLFGCLANLLRRG
jgi:hypothetical protein